MQMGGKTVTSSCSGVDSSLVRVHSVMPRVVHLDPEKEDVSVEMVWDEGVQSLEDDTVLACLWVSSVKYSVA